MKIRDILIGIKNWVTGKFALKSEIPDVSGFATESDLSELNRIKQNLLVDGDNIKTFGGRSLLGNGDAVTTLTFVNFQITGSYICFCYNNSLPPNFSAIIATSFGYVLIVVSDGVPFVVDFSGRVNNVTQSDIARSFYVGIGNSGTARILMLESDAELTVSGTALRPNDLQEYSFKRGYFAPSGGIPGSDLAFAVRTSLGKADSALQQHQDISGKEDKSNKVTTISSASTDAQYPSAKAVYDAIAGGGGGGGEVNIIDGVQVNGNDLIPDLDKKVNITVPYQLASLTGDSTHRVVSDTEKSTWSAKYEKPGSGIPSDDMTAAVQASLGKADTAVQPAAIANFITKSDVLDGATKIIVLTQAQYDGITPDANTLYFIKSNA